MFAMELKSWQDQLQPSDESTKRDCDLNRVELNTNSALVNIVSCHFSYVLFLSFYETKIGTKACSVLRVGLVFEALHL